MPPTVKQKIESRALKKEEKEEEEKMHFNRTQEDSMGTFFFHQRSSPGRALLGHQEGTSLAARSSDTNQSCDTADVGVTPDVQTRRQPPGEKRP